MKHLLGIDIGGTKCAVIAGNVNTDDSIEIVEKYSFPTNVELGVEQTLQHIYESIDKIVSELDWNSSSIESMGISCGGPLDSNRGIILSPPNLPSWDNISIVEMLEERYQIKCKLQNDANACALAEWKFGAAKGCDNVIFLTFGTGMGAGLILNGKLYDGKNGMAGEVGHMRLAEMGPVGYGKAGSFEGFCSGGGIAQLARLMVLEKLQLGIKVPFCNNIEDLPTLSAKNIAEAAMLGDELAISIYQTCGRYLGKALSVLIDLINPEMIVIGSIYKRSKVLLENSMYDIIQRETLPISLSVCKIVPAGLGENIGDIAALAAGYSN